MKPNGFLDEMRAQFSMLFLKQGTVPLHPDFYSQQREKETRFLPPSSEGHCASLHADVRQLFFSCHFKKANTKRGDQS
jgi:hypothetical protein